MTCARRDPVHISWAHPQRGKNLLVFGIPFVLLVLMTHTAQAQTFTVLYKFTGRSDGGSPAAPLILDNFGNLYGTTYQGGDLTCPYPGSPYGCGTVFKVDTSGNETVLYSFKVLPDGKYPYAALIRAAGYMYGTTAYGGASAYGTVFKLDATGNETVLHSFAGGSDSKYPFAALIRDTAGNLYGTTQGDGFGNDYGTVFKVDPSGNQTVLHNFRGAPDGGNPIGALILDRAGNLYGTTYAGGSGACSGGCGIVFKVDPAGNETVLHSFIGPDGRNPRGALILDRAGTLYGSTYAGGAYGGGTVFKLDTTGQETVLYSFAGNLDGEQPTGGLVRDGAGNLYGTTIAGGPRGTGTIFKIDTTGKETHPPCLQQQHGGLRTIELGAGRRRESLRHNVPRRWRQVLHRRLRHSI